MNQICLAGLLLLTLSIYCPAQKILLNDNLEQHATMMTVKGRQGWMVNQKLTFGNYQTSRVDRSWTKGYDFPFIIRFTGAKEKLNYTVLDDRGNKATVFCLGKLREQDLLIFRKYFDLNIKVKDAFTGSVALDTKTSYDFYVANLNQNNWFKEALGWIKHDDQLIAIDPIKHLRNGKRMLGMQVPGFEFVMDGKVVGAVEVLNKGKIWVDERLEPQQKLVLVSVATALLLRSELDSHNDDI